jgi:hypothetical protein
VDKQHQAIFCVSNKGSPPFTGAQTEDTGLAPLCHSRLTLGLVFGGMPVEVFDAQNIEAISGELQGALVEQISVPEVDAL